MPYTVPVEDAQKLFPSFTFVKPLTPSAQKAAFHVRDNEDNNLCLKLISPDYSMDRLDREIQAMLAVDHPNVVNLLEYTFSSKQGDRRHYIIEEFIEGDDLTGLLGTPWEPSRASKFFSTLLGGLGELNRINVVHRDIKPSNIRVRLNDDPVIIDFGLARHLDLSDLTDTLAGAQIGTPTYFSPEQFTGNKNDIDLRTDLFAVGILLYEALIGHHPFHTATTRQQLQDAVCNSEAHLKTPAFTELPRPWQLLLSRLMAKDRVKRPHNASQAATLLQKLEAHS